MQSFVGVLFDGFAYGMLLFLLSVGLSVTLGMMNFVNLAHCSFAMVGGYVTVSLVNTLGWPFLAALPMAFLAAALVSVLLERTLYRRLYRASDLDQCLFTIGIVFISVAAAAWIYGTVQQPVNTPSFSRISAGSGFSSSLRRCSCLSRSERGQRSAPRIHSLLSPGPRFSSSRQGSGRRRG